MRVRLPNTVRIDYSHDIPAPPNTVPFTLMLEIVPGHVPGYLFTFAYHSTGNDIQRTYAKGAMEGEFCLRTGHLGGLIASLERKQLMNKWFMNHEGEIEASDELSRAILKGEPAPVHGYSVHPATLKLVQMYGGFLALKRHHPGSSLFEHMRSLANGNAGFVVPVTDRTGVVRTRTMPMVIPEHFEPAAAYPGVTQRL